MGLPPQFDWDNGNLAKCQKHGVSIAEIEELFTWDPYIGRDEEHSDREDRYVAVGKRLAGRSVLVIFTLRTRKRRGTHQARQCTLHAWKGGTLV